jgi:hypothetical protein
MAYGMKKEKGMGASKMGSKKMGAKKMGAMKKGAKKMASSSSSGLTAAQKKLPPALQKAIMNRKKSK